MEKYQDVIDQAIRLAEAAAKMTGNKWDDLIAGAARAMFERFLKEPRIFGAGHVVATPIEAAAIPAWLMPLVLELVRYLMSLKKNEVN
jgi:hypothetical protein